MYEKYPISGIKQSYNHSSETKTVIMPLLIVGLIAGLAVFYFKGDPTKQVAEPIQIASVEPEIAEDSIPEPAAKMDISKPVESNEQPAESAPAETPTEAPLEETPEKETVKVSARSESGGTVETESIEAAYEDGFTPWMSPTDLDAYIRSKAEGPTKSFWDKGHWITAIEGRWGETSHEFRIAYDSIPDLDSWQWKYRIDLTEDQFAASVTEMLSQGYNLVHTQTYALPDQSRRFQGVWHKQVKVPQVVEAKTPPLPETEVGVATSSSAASSPPIAQPEISNDSRALDVNRLQFR